MPSTAFFIENILKPSHNEASSQNKSTLKTDAQQMSTSVPSAFTPHPVNMQFGIQSQQHSTPLGSNKRVPFKNATNMFPTGYASPSSNGEYANALMAAAFAALSSVPRSSPVAQMAAHLQTASLKHSPDGIFLSLILLSSAYLEYFCLNVIN